MQVPPAPPSVLLLGVGGWGGVPATPSGTPRAGGLGRALTTKSLPPARACPCQPRPPCAFPTTPAPCTGLLGDSASGRALASYSNLPSVTGAVPAMSQRLGGGDTKEMQEAAWASGPLQTAQELRQLHNPLEALA